MFDTRNIIKILKFYKIFWGVFLILMTANLVAYFSVVRNQGEMINSLQIEYAKDRRSPVKKAVHGRELFFKARKDLDIFKSTLPSMTMVSDRIRNLFRKLQEDGPFANVSTFKPERVKKLGLLKYSASLNVVMDYGKIKKMLGDISGSKDLFCIDKLRLQKDVKSGMINMKLGISTYCREQ